MAAAKQQPEPQRLLFVFLKATLPKAPNDEQIENFHTGQGGELDPVMSVDKTLDELGSFDDLVAESASMGQEWHLVLVAGLAGQNGVAPTSKDAEEPINMMTTTVRSGGDLSKYIAFDKTGSPVYFS